MCARIVSRRPRQLDRREIERQHNARLDLWLGGGNSPRRFAAHVRRPTDGYKAEDIGGGGRRKTGLFALRISRLNPGGKWWMKRLLGATLEVSMLIDQCERNRRNLSGSSDPRVGTENSSSKA